MRDQSARTSSSVRGGSGVEVFGSSEDIMPGLASISNLLVKMRNYSRIARKIRPENRVGKGER